MAQPRKPTSILEKSGAFARNPKRGRARANEPQYPAGVPAPPAFMKGPALEEYGRLAVLLGSRKVLQETDWGALIAYCQHWGDMVTTWQDGRPVHPSALAEYRRLAANLGLTPADRSKVAALEAAKPENEWAQFLTQTAPSDTLKPS